MARFRLASVLRARLAQEDVAKAEVVRSRGAARSARHRVDERTRALRATDLPDGVNGRAVVAAMVARRALAGDLAGAEGAARTADEDTDERVADLADAAKRRRMVEKLAERHASRRRATADAADQRANDEIAVTAAIREGLHR